MTSTASSAGSAIEAARRIKVAMDSIVGKRLPIKFPDDETAMVFACIIENAGRVTRAYIKACEALEALGAAISEADNLDDPAIFQAMEIARAALSPAPVRKVED